MKCASLLAAFLLAAWIPVCAEQAPGPDLQKAVEEFKALTADLGLRADSPARSRQSPTAGSRWHGRLFEYFRNDILDAVPHEVRQAGGTKGILRRNQFGFNLSGPVVIPRLYSGVGSTFFSVSYEGVRESIGRSFLRTIPTVPERRGDYSEVVDSAGNLLPIYDPQSTSLNPAFDSSRPVSRDNLQYLRGPFPGNRMPASRLDPAAQRDLRYYPEPNTNIGPFFRNNYFVLSPETNVANGMITKLEQNVRKRHRLNTGLNFSDGLAGSAKWFPSAANPGPADRRYRNRSASFGHVFTISPQTVNTLSFSGWTSSSRNEIEFDDTGKPLSVYRFSPYLSMGRSFPISTTSRSSFELSEAISIRRGQHSLRIVAEIERNRVNSYWPQYPSGHHRFSSGLTSLPGIVNTGHAFASFVLGLVDFAEVSKTEHPSYFRTSRALLAVREQYEVRRGLTLSAGLNLDISWPRVERYNRQATVDLTVLNPENGRPGAFVVAGTDGQPRSFQPVRKRLEPSISLSWSPRGNARSVVRFGFSRSYAPIPLHSGQWGTQGFNGNPTYISPNVQLQPAAVLRNGLPPPANPVPDLRPVAVNHTIADLMDRTARQPVYQSIGVSFERELPGLVVVTLGLGRSSGRDLLVGNTVANPNAISLAALSYRDRLNDEVFNRSLRPYPQYQRFDVYSDFPMGTFVRHGLSLRTEKRISRGLSLSSTYEYSKQLDDYSGPFGTQDYYNRANERSLSAYNDPHRLSLTCMYELPFGVGRAIFQYSDWRRHLVDGWSFTTSSSYSSGEPTALMPEFNNTGKVVDSLRVDVAPGVNPHVAQRRPELWFNPAAFAHPADFSVGNASRTHPTLRNPSRQNHDISVNKRFPLASDRSMEFNAAAFNFINHANWNDPDVVIGPASAPNVNAGKIIGSRGGRVIQLGLRYSF